MLPQHDDFLRSHRWCLLATTRSTGAPQVSMVAYHYDGVDFVISCRWTTAKFVNAHRRPDVVVTVPDGRTFLAVEGAAKCVTADPARADATRRVQSALDGGDFDAIEGFFAGGLDVAERGIIEVTPRRVLGRI